MKTSEFVDKLIELRKQTITTNSHAEFKARNSEYQNFLSTYAIADDETMDCTEVALTAIEAEYHARDGAYVPGPGKGWHRSNY